MKASRSAKASFSASAIRCSALPFMALGRALAQIERLDELQDLRHGQAARGGRAHAAHAVAAGRRRRRARAP